MSYRTSLTRSVGLWVAGVAIAAWGAVAWGQDRDTKVRNDLNAFQANDAWVYNNLLGAFAEARDAKKPILAVLRCVP